MTHKRSLYPYRFCYYRGEREHVKEAFKGHFCIEKLKFSLLADPRRATYAAFLASMIQGIMIIELADETLNFQPWCRPGEAAASLKLTTSPR